MASAQRIGVYALSIGFFLNAQGASVKAFGKDGKEGKNVTSENSSRSVTEFQWKDHGKLSWDDFRGPVHAANDESAAATHCGIGFRINPADQGSKPEVQVYNTFYVNKSWVRSDAKIQSILDHEQGHFDLCEIYTRMLKARMNSFDFNAPNVKNALMNIFNEVNDAYEVRQQQYESETVHGTDFPEQRKWQRAIIQELGSSGSVTASAR